MMYSSPYYPHFFYKPRYSYPHFDSKMCLTNQNKPLNKYKADNQISNKNSKTKKEEKSTNSFENEIIEIFGINLYYDDILLICLIFFLYNEGVKDEFLFIVLILLLLS